REVPFQTPDIHQFCPRISRKGRHGKKIGLLGIGPAQGIDELLHPFIGGAVTFHHKIGAQQGFGLLGYALCQGFAKGVYADHSRYPQGDGKDEQYKLPVIRFPIPPSHQHQPRKAGLAVLCHAHRDICSILPQRRAILRWVFAASSRSWVTITKVVPSSWLSSKRSCSILAPVP